MNEKVDERLKELYEQGEFQKLDRKKIFLSEMRTYISRLLNIFFIEDDSRLQFLRENGFNKNKHITDVGCGEGYFIQLLEKKGYKKISGIEIDEERAELAKKYLKNKEIIFTKNLNDIKIKADYVSLIHVFEHLKNPRRILRNIDKESILFIEVPNCENKKVLDFSMQISHISHFTHESIENILEKEGWKIIKFETVQSFYMNKRISLKQILMWLLFHKDPCRDIKFYDGETESIRLIAIHK